MGPIAPPFPAPYATILVVDDERIARRVAYRLLSEESFRVLESAGAAEAMDVLGQAGGRVDLVLIDVVMPDEDGVDLAAMIEAEWPETPILFMSAHPAEVLAQRGLKELKVEFLAKPYTRDELLAKVRRLLDRRRVPRAGHPTSPLPREKPTE